MKTFLVLFTLAFLAFIWAAFIEPDQLFVKEYTVKVKNWPAELSGLRIAVISDIHAGAPYVREKKLKLIAEKTNQARPEMILYAGDFVQTGLIGGINIGGNAIAMQLAKAKAPLGEYAVLGNHDNAHQRSHLGEALQKNGIDVLEDKIVEIKRDNKSFFLLGISDYYTAKHDYKKALAAAGSAPVLALTHTPDIFPELPDNILLAFAGHTHGGQIFIPFLTKYVIPSRYGDRYIKGDIIEGNKHFFVTSGIGTSGLPLRFLVPPEISIVTVVSE